MGNIDKVIAITTDNASTQIGKDCSFSFFIALDFSGKF
jgi:hypothetical protein